MKNRSRKAALEIRLLLEEYTADELNEALALIGGQTEEDLGAFLKRVAATSSEERPQRRRGSPSTRGETKALQLLKETDPEKYLILSELEQKIRAGAVLPTLDDIKSYGNVLWKDYRPAKSRKDALVQLISMLSKLDMTALRAAIAKIPVGRTSGEGDFGRLAEHIITGGTPRSPGN
ncbi:MAG: hypothetical protein GYA21_07585 [Myxococcales bacterium]|nr:hypothetical protein [Myxococcales bacterium]